MNSSVKSELNLKELLVLRSQAIPLPVLVETLRVREMGPADHIHTKHEAKAFLISGDVQAAEELLKHAQERRLFWQTKTVGVLAS